MPTMTGAISTSGHSAGHAAHLKPSEGQHAVLVRTFENSAGRRVTDAKGAHDRENLQISEHRQHAEDDEQRAHDLVQTLRIAPRAVLSDQLRHRTAVPQVADREVAVQRRREHPQAPRGFAEVIDR
jgi:hypothetical protein